LHGFFSGYIFTASKFLLFHGTDWSINVAIPFSKARRCPRRLHLMASYAKAVGDSAKAVGDSAKSN